MKKWLLPVCRVGGLCMLLTLHHCAKDDFAPTHSSDPLTYAQAPMHQASKAHRTIQLDRLTNPNLSLHDATPGEVIYLKGQYKGRLIIRDVKGAPGAPVRIIGLGSVSSQEEFGLILFNCKYMEISGLKLNRGLATWGDCTDLDIHHLTIRGENKATIGMLIKNDVAGRDYPWFDNMRIHHNTITNCTKEGMYIGRFTYYANPKYQNPYGHRLRNLAVYENVVMYCGWDGIQVGCADENAAVYNNRLIGNATENRSHQNFGLCINSGFKGAIYGNLVAEENGLGGTVQLLPFSNTDFHHNEIRAPSAREAIFIRTEPNNGGYLHTDPNMRVVISDNKISAGQDAIYLYDSPLNGSPVPIRELIVHNNQLNIKGQVLNYKGDKSRYKIQQ